MRATALLEPGVLLDLHGTRKGDENRESCPWSHDGVRMVAPQKLEAEITNSEEGNAAGMEVSLRTI